MKHRHLHKHRHKNRVKYYVSILIILLVFIGLISYYIVSKRQPSWNDDYSSYINFDLNRDMDDSLGSIIVIGQRIPIKSILIPKDVQPYELIIQNEIAGIIQEVSVTLEFNSCDRPCRNKWDTFFIQYAMRLTDDISWEEFEDMFENTSYGNKMFASNFNMEQPDGSSNGNNKMFVSNFNMGQPDESSNSPFQDQTEENIESSVVNPSEEDLEPIIQQWAYNVGGNSFHSFNRGLSGLVSLVTNKSDDHTNKGQQSPQNENNVPIPEPSTFILTGLGLLFLSQWLHRSRITH